MKTIYSSTLKICLITVLLTLFTGVLVRAQDVIVQKNGEEIKAKVEQILDTEIKYRKADNLTGPIYSVKKADVFMIKYANGTKDVFTGQPVVSSAQIAPVQKISFTDKDLQPAHNATILGGVLVIPILGLGITSGAIDDNPGLTIPMGAVATLIGAIGIPVVAHMAGKTRNATGVEGNPGLRLVGWIGYGLALSDACAVLGLAIGGANTSGALTYSVTALGSVASILFAIEANQTYGQAKSLKTSSSIQPTFGTIRDYQGKQYPVMGIKINF
jgi:hypothetical protein